MTLSNDAKAVLALTTRLGDRNRPSLSVGAWHRLVQVLRDAGLSPASVFDADFGSVPITGVDTEHLRTLVGGSVSVFVELDALSSKGIWVATIVDGGYPDRLRALGEAAPPCVFGVGNASLLRDGGLAVVGSRDVDPDGAGAAQLIAEAACAWGLALISGGARGVDQLAMNAAFLTGGRVVGVLADSLEYRIRRADVISALDGGNTCLIVQQHPAVGFTPQAAMARNKLVYALADLTVVIAANDGSGGTWAGAEEALRRHYGHVAVWRGPGEGPGNAALEKTGAVGFRSVDELKAILDQPASPCAPQQLTMI
jgi:predicted Rossmann fold nucleotide-binding protein DprA/Smf involved in DNA uptake